MGIACSSEPVVPVIISDNGSRDIEQINTTDIDITNCFLFKSYRHYFDIMGIFKEKLKLSLSKIILIKHFTPPQRKNKELEIKYYNYLDDVSAEKLFDVAMCVYQKIGAIYGNSQNYPKSELSKINYGLIAKYRAYDYDTEDELTVITEKIIKRTNFFSEDFPFKLKRLERILQSRKIFAFGYDNNLRLNFYIEPYESSNYHNDLQKEKHFYFIDQQEKNSKNDSNKNITLVNADYIVYMFFIIEHVLPLLVEQFHYSELVNLVINFGGKEADTELISFIMTYFNSYYPLGLGKVHIVNFRIELLKRNMTFRTELDQLDYFRNLVFHNESYQFQFVKDCNPNCLPIEYGGYHTLASYTIGKNFKLEDFIDYTLSMILINSV